MNFECTNLTAIKLPILTGFISQNFDHNPPDYYKKNTKFESP